MDQDAPTPLPRPPDDPENLRRLREEAVRRVEQEERARPITIYGEPPAPVYGGPPPPPSTYSAAPPPPAPAYGGAPAPARRWSLVSVVLLIVAALALVAAWLASRK
jgi:hypothetical protein